MELSTEPQRIELRTARPSTNTVCCITNFETNVATDISVIGALVIGVENNFTGVPTETGLPPHSFRFTIVGGKQDDIAQCIHDNRSLGTISVGDTWGIAHSSMGEYVEQFNHIEIDRMMKAIDFMDTWNGIADKIKEKVTK